jgi:hypothetical protein
MEFIGGMQPAFAMSASGTVDALHILSGFIILYYVTKKIFFMRSFILFLSIVLFWILSDARSSLFIMLSLIFFYFLIKKLNKKVIFIIFFLFLMFQKDLYDSGLNTKLINIQNVVVSFFNFEKGYEIRPAAIKLSDGEFYHKEKIGPVYDDFGRTTYFLAAIHFIEFDFIKFFFGCGFYKYYECAEKYLSKIYFDAGVPMPGENIGFLDKKIRPPAAGTIIVENGFLVILLACFYYLNFLKNRFYVSKEKYFCNFKKILLSIYTFTTIISFMFFSNIMDIGLLYLFLLPLFNRYLFFKI